MPIRTNSGTESDVAVDELKRRARRRLVGAVVLALAAAVILPLLLESDPKPLGDDVSIKIPPVDNERFVNPLSPDKAGAPGASDAKPGPSTPRKSIAEAERRVLGQPATPVPAPAATPTVSVPVTPPAGPAPAPATAPPAVTVAPVPAAPGNVPAKVDTPAKVDPPAKTDTTVKPDAAAKSDPPAAAATPVRAMPPRSMDVNGKTPDSAATVDAAAAFSVQVGAFVDAKAAADLAQTLKRGGFPAYTEGVATTQGTVQRVRVGPFSTRAAADAGLAKLKAAGYGSAVVKSPQ